MSAAIFIVALLVRCIPFAFYVTPDEPIWVLRSVQAMDALSGGRWSAIPQTGHPGVTTMVLGALGIRLTFLVAPAQAETHLAWIRNLAWLAPENGAAFPHLAFFLPGGRLLVALTTSLGVVLAYWLARTRVGVSAARWLAIFLALDPFVSGHSGLLHTDALQATAVLLATLLVLPRRGRETSTLELAGAGLCLALAGLTKSLGFLAAPGVAVLLLFWGRRSWLPRVSGALFLMLVTLCCTYLGYPPLWSDPAEALSTLLGAVEYHGGIGLRDVFFAGQLRIDPGPLFYPIVLLFRMTPVVLIGLVGAILRKDLRSGLVFRGMLLPALVYLVGLTVATKKFDRYVLTVVPLVTAVAAWFWAQHHIRQRWLLAAALLIPWVVVAVIPLYYSDPLLGGPWLAQQVIPLGWGEASGFAGRSLNRLLEDPQGATLLAENVPGAAPFFAGTTWAWDDDDVGCADVLLGQEVDSGLSSSTRYDVTVAGLRLTHLLTQTLTLSDAVPVILAGHLPGVRNGLVAPNGDLATLKVWLEGQIPAGTPFLWIHLSDCYPITEAQLRQLLGGDPAGGGARCEAAGSRGGFDAELCTLGTVPAAASSFEARFAGGLDVLATALPDAVQAPDSLAVPVRWQGRIPLGDLRFHIVLRDPQGSVLWAENSNALLDTRGWSTSSWPVGEITEGDVYVPIPLDLPPGVYSVTLSLADAGGQLVGIGRPDGSFAGTRLKLGEITVLPARYAAQNLDLPVLVGASVHGLALTGASELPAQLWAGEPLPFRLGWERRSGDVPSAFEWELACESGEPDGGTLPVAPQSPASWPVGYRYEGHYAPRTNPSLGGGSCRLAIRLDQQTNIAVGTFEVYPRARRFDLPDEPQVALSVGLEGFAELIGTGIMPAEAGLHLRDPASVTLYFAAAQAADTDFTVFVHLIGPDGRIWAQSDSWPQAGATPTTSWVEGQIIVDTHRLVLPEGAPVGSYTLKMGLYDAVDGTRVELRDVTGNRVPGDSLLIGTLQVVP